MKTIDTVYRVELTADEVEIITTALHGEYKFIRAEREKSQENAARLYDKMRDVRTVRNNFADLCGRRYMGEDA